MLVEDYISGLDVTRVSVWEVRNFKWNPKQNSRIRKKVIDRALSRASYVKVPIGYWEAVVSEGILLRPQCYVVAVGTEYRLHLSRLESKAAFLRRTVDYVAKMRDDSEEE